jgi:2-polyprenyl-3-methyl-5-hydroxy-6-metoxy-1,4-benzoquinol methylase
MGVTLTRECFRLDRTWSPAEFDRYKRLIEERPAWHYYQQFIVEDAAGRRLETPGPHNSVGVITLLDKHGFPQDFTGKTVLDIGCNAGFYSFVAKLRGAKSVLGVDHQREYINEALLMREILGIDVEFRQGDGHELAEGAGPYDIVINTGVIYHLQNPMDFLSKVANVTREMMYLETESLTDPNYSEYAWFIEREYGGDISNWWVYGPLCAERMARAAGFSDVQFQGFVWLPPSGMKTPEGHLRQGRAAFVCRK